MSDHGTPHYDIGQVRACFTMVELLDREKPGGHVLKKQGGRWVMPCPFHGEKSASFGTDSQRPGHAHCFGCGWDGSTLDFWMAWREVDLKTAIAELAVLGGLTPRDSGVTWRSGPKKMPLVTQVAQAETVNPALPRMRQLKDAEMEEIAATRGLSVEGVRIAALTYRRAGFCLWPQFMDRRGDWRMSDEAVPSWCMTDDMRHCAEFRRIDNKLYPTRSLEDGKWVLNAEDKWIKAWSTKGKAWPLGAAELGTRKAVAWVKGGPDMLAAYHFLHGFKRLQDVAVVAMLGESARIRDDALPYFRDARVRIFFDADKIQEKRIKKRDGTVRIRRTRPGFDAAARWTDQLTAAGAAVKGFSFADMHEDDEDWDITPSCIRKLRRVDGAPVKDLNDLARCNADVVDHDFMKLAFFDFDF